MIIAKDTTITINGREMKCSHVGDDMAHPDKKSSTNWAGFKNGRFISGGFTVEGKMHHYGTVKQRNNGKPWSRRTFKKKQKMANNAAKILFWDHMLELEFTSD